MKNYFFLFILAAGLFFNPLKNIAQTVAADCNVTWTYSPAVANISSADIGATPTIPAIMKDKIVNWGVKWSTVSSASQTFTIADYFVPPHQFNYQNSELGNPQYLCMGCHFDDWKGRTFTLNCNTTYYYTFFIVFDITDFTTGSCTGSQIITGQVNNRTYALCYSQVKSVKTLPGKPITGNMITTYTNALCADWSIYENTVYGSLPFLPNKPIYSQTALPVLTGGDGMNYNFTWQVSYNGGPFADDTTNREVFMSSGHSYATSYENFFDLFKFTTGGPLPVSYRRKVTSAGLSSTSPPVTITYYPGLYEYMYYNNTLPFSTQYVTSIKTGGSVDSLTIELKPNVPKLLYLHADYWEEVTYDTASQYFKYDYPYYFNWSTWYHSFGGKYIPTNTTSLTVPLTPHTLIRAHFWPGCLNWLGPLYSVFYDTDLRGTAVLIGSQLWTQSNLAVDKFNDGTPIAEAKNLTEWAKLTNTDKVAAYYNDGIYGNLYNGYVIKSSKNVCPVGWHIPSDNEWKILTGNNSVGALADNSGGLWSTPGTIQPNNSSGFNGLPGGYINTGNTLASLNHYGVWWSANQKKLTDWFIQDSQSQIQTISNQPLNAGFSIRCIKD